ncbi:MAG: hypothetical protein ABIQ04_01280 [Candidatus Saccharimonadales bacterium]
MPSTPRSQAARQFSSEESCPFPGKSAPESELKPPHYGESAKVIDAAMNKFLLAYSDSDSDIRQTQTQRSLSRTIASELERAYMLIQSNPKFYDTIEYLEESQQCRHRQNENRWSSFDDTFIAGIQTALNATENIYDTLAPLAPADQLCHPKTSGIARHIALMHNRQFVAFRDTYLQWQSASVGPILDLKDLLTISSDEVSHWLAFRPDYPGKAPVLRRFVDFQGKPIIFASDMAVSDPSTEPMVTIEDIELPTDSPIVGCPLTFMPKHMKAFWDVYCTERSRIDRQLKTGKQVLHHINT